MLIRVFYTKGYHDLANPEFLDYLIETKKIKYFYRSSGKVILGVDKVRSQRTPYFGVERRRWSKKPKKCTASMSATEYPTFYQPCSRRQRPSGHGKTFLLTTSMEHLIRNP